MNKKSVMVVTYRVKEGKRVQMTSELWKYFTELKNQCEINMTSWKRGAVEWRLF